MRSWLRNHFFKRTEERKERERAFLENGSMLLEKLIVSCNAKPIPIRTFSAQELRQATDNYANRQFWHWYKGSLEGRMVFVNRFSDYEFMADLIINDLVISAQMSGHSNVLKPIGCCLETPFPISVYEFPANGLLADRVYVSDVAERKHQPMAWGSRLKIARQIAHGETEVEAHKNIRNWFLSTPELKASGKVTEKNDVYNFGQLLLELLTGEDCLQITRLPIGEYSSLVAYMHNSAQGRSINEIVDPAILAEEGGVSLDQQLQAVLKLGLTCTEEDPHRRPTMVDVTKELRRIESINKIVDPKTLIEEVGACIEQQLQAVLHLGLTCIEEDPKRRPTMVYVTKELRHINRQTVDFQMPSWFTMAQRLEIKRQSQPHRYSLDLDDAKSMCINIGVSYYTNINLWPLYALDTDGFMIPSLEIGDIDGSKTDASEVEASKPPSPKVSCKNPDNITRLPIDKDSSLVAYMHNGVQGRSINEIVDPAILAEEGGVSLDQQLQAVLELSLTCTEEDPHRRPTMVDVTKELRRIESV
uniref:Protein kinase domain-containing protein n=1 Tax=Fagus sylvatica TaxID=28930 RepID=A0A2N9IPE4_FAGSY